MEASRYDTQVHATKNSSTSFSYQNHNLPPSNVVDPEARSEVDYGARANWLRAAVLGANDGLVSVASLMIGVGAVNQTSKAMLVSGLAGLVAGACSMAIGEFVSVHAQYDIQKAQNERRKKAAEEAASRGLQPAEKSADQEEDLPSPMQAAFASALAVAVGGILPLLAGLVRPWGARVGVVCGVTSVGLVGFGAAGGYLGGANMRRSAFRVLICGWLAMAITYGVLRLFGFAFKTHVESA